MTIPKELIEEINHFCTLNGIDNDNKFLIKIFKQGWLVEKYGNSPITTPEIVEKEIIREVEKIVEVPIEIIKEVVKEIEVPIEKIVYVNSDDDLLKIKELELELMNLKKIFTTDSTNNTIQILNDKILKLETLLDLERNRNIPPKKKANEIEVPKNIDTNVINWVSKDERNNNDLYNE